MEIQNIFYRSIITTILVTWVTCFAFQPVVSQTPRKVVIGYVGGFRGLVNTAIIEADKLTHINYAFVDIQNNRAWLHNEVTDTTNFRMLNELKKINAGLKILISIGGWSWSENFSDAVLTDSSRKIFASSAAEIIHRHNLDGIDIDWEYPGMKGEEGNIYRPEDKHNFTLMFAQLRNALDSLERITRKKYLLTTAVGGSQSFIQNSEMDKVAAYLDFINLMTYDFSWRIAGHHANLFHAKNDTSSSADKTVKAYIKAGVPVSKLVMGLAFYGKGSVVGDSGGKWFYKPVISTTKGGGYSFLKDSLVNKAGYKSFWDRRAKSPYLFNKNEKTFISYENERAIKIKCRYVIKNDLAGVMFWEYFSDPKGYLLNAITDVFR